MSILKATDLSCEKQDRTLFSNIDLSIDAGDILLLRGENGAGKTSLLRILVGLSEPMSGKVLINDHCVHSELDFAAPQFVYCGHKLGHNSLLSATENLLFWSELHGQTPKKQDIIMVLEELGLTGLDDLPIKNLSAGQQRKVSLAKLFLTPNAKLWVLDEPFTALDVGTVKLIESKIEAFSERGGAVIMTSHQAVSIERGLRVFELEYNW